MPPDPKGPANPVRLTVPAGGPGAKLPLAAPSGKSSSSATGESGSDPTGEVNFNVWNGQGGIRTLETLTGLPVFETGSFSHSDTCPLKRKSEEEK